MSEAHILIVDDDDRLRGLLKRYLREQGFDVSTASHAAEARAMLSIFTFDLMVLDVMMPGETGIEFAQHLPAGAPPVLMLSARSEAEDRIAGFEAGVDDYLTKPFEPKELTLRIRAILRRHARQQEAARRVTFGEFSFDPEANQLLKGGEPVYLTTTEAALLRILAERSGEAVPREELARLTGAANERAVDVQITRLRKKIEASEGKPVHIQTVRGAGYGLFRA